ncbi:transketolase family protein [Candidatus Woesebacteria bacterium]|nr:transketolase family protein [Candidatus Woesebacteria bacterium]
MEIQKQSTRDGFGQGLLEAARSDEQVVGLCADLTESTKMLAFAKEFPQRFIEVGVAEQNLAGLAAGFALAGKIPFTASYACFHPANSWGVIRTSIAYSNLNVKIIGGHAGLVTGADGATHQSLEDIALMRVLPNFIVVVPCDYEEARKATLALARHNGPAYLRTNKLDQEPITTKDTPFTLGQAIQLRAGRAATIIACGSVVQEALSAATILEQHNIDVRVLNMHTIKPLDTLSILNAARETGALITVEDHQQIGGLGSAVAEVLAQSGRRVPFRSMGVADTFGESGTAAQLLEKYELSASHIVQQINELLANTRK